jgi:hypothetical protein
MEVTAPVRKAVRLAALVHPRQRVLADREVVEDCFQASQGLLVQCLKETAVRLLA